MTRSILAPRALARSLPQAAPWLESDPVLGQRAFQLFWCVYALLHFPLTAPHWLPWPWIRHLAAAAWLLSAWALLRTDSLARFTALVAVWTAADLVALPFVPNHVLLTLFVNVTFLVAMAEAAWRRWRRGEPAPLAMAGFAGFAPLARIEVLTLYAWAALHKLNDGYLDPATSCGWSFYREIADRLVVLPSGELMRHPVIGASLLAEAALPALLYFRRTRVAGVIGAVAFHLMLSIHPGWLLESFGCAALALLTLFVPGSWLRSAAAGLRRAGARSRRAVQAIGAVVLASVAAAVLWLAVGGGAEIGPRLRGAARVGWFVWAALVTLALTALLVRRRAPDRGLAGRFLPPRLGLAALLPAAVLLNGAAPYVGLKTETSFSMFSNLRTEAGEENHLFLPRLDWFELQDDVVEIAASSAPELARFAASGERLVWFEVRRALDRRRDEGIRVTYRRNGRSFEASSAEPIPLLLDRTLVFRPLPPAGAPASCRH